jgi:aminomethyltransferase
LSQNFGVPEASDLKPYTFSSNAELLHIGDGAISKGQPADLMMSEIGSGLARTPLYGLHQSLGAKMVPFAGYEMPLHYRPGILNEHLHTRTAAGLFDVSHMGQAYLHGFDPATALERLTPADVAGLRDGQMRYALLLNQSGGIKDDFMVARLPEKQWLYLVVNASTKISDFAYISECLSGFAALEPQPDRALLALQGPKAEEVLSRYTEGLGALTFMRLAEFRIAGVTAVISRSGYTGEDGFEISLTAQDAEKLAGALISEPEVLPVGLGARDTLRLEAGLCLYGHDIDEKTTPIEADLAWTIGKRRKQVRDFPAAEQIMAELLNGPRRKRIGIRLLEKTPARDGAELVERAGTRLGRVTSGGFGPSMGGAIGMGYVPSGFATDGTELAAIVRGTARAAVVSPLPFVPHRYRRRSEG